MLALYSKRFNRYPPYLLNHLKNADCGNPVLQCREGRFSKVLNRAGRNCGLQPTEAPDSTRFENKDLCFVMFWGALGKVIADKEDLETILFLKKFKEELETNLERTQFKIILADEHARMNGFEDLKTYTYLQNIKDMLESNGFETVYLSFLWKKWNLIIEKITNSIGESRITNSKLFDSLVKSSKKHYKLGNPREGALKYYSMRRIEKTFLESEFKDHIFLTYNPPSFREILPEMPTLYIYAKKGFSRPPWIP